MSTPQNSRRFAVLYVDDEEQALKYFRKGFDKDFPVLTAPGVTQAIELLEKEHANVGVLLTDQRMPGGSGVELLTRVRKTWPDIVRIMLTAYSGLDNAIAAVNCGAVHKYLTKPMDHVQMREVLLEAMDMFVKQHERESVLNEKMSSLRRMIVADRVRGIAAMASGISHHLRNSMTAMSCYFEEVDSARPEGSTAAAPAGENLLGELLTMAKQERSRLLSIVQEVGQRAAEPSFRCVDEADLYDLLEQAQADARTAGFSAPVELEIKPGAVALKVDRAAIVRTIRGMLLHVARHTQVGGLIRVRATAPVPHWNTSGVRLCITGTGPAWTEKEVASFFTPFAVSMKAPTELCLDMLDAFFTASGHGGDLITLPEPPDGPGFELRLPTDPALVSRPEMDDDRLSGLLNRVAPPDPVKPAA